MSASTYLFTSRSLSILSLNVAKGGAPEARIMIIEPSGTGMPTSRCTELEEVQNIRCDVGVLKEAW